MNSEVVCSNLNLCFFILGKRKYMNDSVEDEIASKKIKEDNLGM